MKTTKFLATAALFALVALMACGSLAQAENLGGGRQGGPSIDIADCPANGSVTYYVTFRAGMAEVAIVGDGRTDLDIFVYDMQGRLVAQGIGPTDIESVRWSVPRPGTYRIVVVNLGNIGNRYALATN
jgi:hypothetical protein